MESKVKGPIVTGKESIHIYPNNGVLFYTKTSNNLI